MDCTPRDLTVLTPPFPTRRSSDLILLLQPTTCLFAVDTDGIESGPLSHFVRFSTGRSFAAVHEGSFNVLLTLIGLHVAFVLFYWVYRRDRLVGEIGRAHV